MRLSRSHVLLAAQYRVIVFEVPGFGHSPANERSQSMPELARTMTQAITNLGLARYNLMGNSFGGTLALWMAVQQPEHLHALVLVAPAAIRLAEAVLPPDALRGTPGPVVRPSRTSDAGTTPGCGDTGQATGPGAPSSDRPVTRQGRLPGLHVPVLVLFGTLDRMIPPAMGRLYCEKLPNCHLILVYDAGHAVDADRPEAFVSVVSDFLQHHEGFLVNRQSGLINP